MARLQRALCTYFMVNFLPFLRFQVPMASTKFHIPVLKDARWVIYKIVSGLYQFRLEHKYCIV